MVTLSDALAAEREKRRSLEGRRLSAETGGSRGVEFSG
jgi:hypothetical protein